MESTITFGGSAISILPTLTWTWTDLDDPTLRGDEDDEDDEDTRVDLLPAGAIAPRETLPPLE